MMTCYVYTAAIITAHLSYSLFSALECGLQFLAVFDLSYHEEYKKYVEQSVVFDRDTHLLIGIIRDITEEQLQKERRESMKSQTIEVADRVVDKQMRIVQEIASLLGETAAETKIALAKLKESITNE